MFKYLSMSFLCVFITSCGTMQGKEGIAKKEKEDKKREVSLKFEIAPVLGYAGMNFFTVACKTNEPAQAILEVNGKEYSSPEGKFHSFKVEGLKPDTSYTYTIEARLPDGEDNVISCPYSIKTFPKGNNIRFAILGDSRTNTEAWKSVADAVLKQKPMFSVFVGDMVTNGLKNKQWDRHFFSTGRDYFANIPFYAVIGNHERNAPLFNKIFKTPNGKKNWAQTIGSTLIIGIDGEMNWQKGGNLYKWLEKTLSDSKADFIFLCNHYPPWSSGYHAKSDDGKLKEETIRTARKIILPLLKKYNASAIFTGHDHFYERSMPDNSIPVIVTGGAGAPLRGKVKNAAKTNPYSKVFVEKFHYCILQVKGKVCYLEVFTPEGEKIDTFEFKARRK